MFGVTQTASRLTSAGNSTSKGLVAPDEPPEVADQFGSGLLAEARADLAHVGELPTAGDRQAEDQGTEVRPPAPVPPGETADDHLLHATDS